MRGVRRRKKLIIEVKAPQMFNNQTIAHIVASDEKSVIGRRLEIILYELTQLPTHYYVKSIFKIIGVEDGVAYTEFDGLCYFREYLRSLFQKGTSYVNIYRDINIEDKRYRIFIDIFTIKRITNSRKKAIRRRVSRLVDLLSNSEQLQFLNSIIYGVFDAEIAKEARKVYPIRWAGVTKIKLIR